MAQSAQAMETLAGKSPSGEEKAYAAAVASRKKSARKTNIFVQIPAGVVKEFTPNASEGGEYNEDGGPTVVEGERQVNQEFIPD